MNFSDDFKGRLADFTDILKEIKFDGEKARVSGVEMFFKINKVEPLSIISLAPNACDTVQELNENLLVGLCEVIGASASFGRIKLDKITKYKNNQLLVTVRIK